MHLEAGTEALGIGILENGLDYSSHKPNSRATTLDNFFHT